MIGRRELVLGAGATVVRAAAGAMAKPRAWIRMDQREGGLA